MNFDNVKQSVYARRTTPVSGDIVVIVRKNDAQTPYYIFYDREHSKYRLINLQSSQSNYSGKSVEECIDQLLNPPNPCRGIPNRMNPIVGYFFIRSGDIDLEASETFGFVNTEDQTKTKRDKTGLVDDIELLDDHLELGGDSEEEEHLPEEDKPF